MMKALQLTSEEVTCMVTGISGNGEQVICAHLVPVRSKGQVLLRELGISAEDINSLSNCAFWALGIESAYETLRISFVKSNPLVDKLYMKIWDDSVKELPIFARNAHKIGEYDNYELKVGHEIMKRALSYQAYQAYLHWAPNNQLVEESCRYASPGIYKFRKTMDIMRSDYLKASDGEVSDTGGGGKRKREGK